MATLSDLLAQKAALDKKIAERQRAERTDAIAQVRKLMAQYGLALSDIGKVAPVTRAGKAAGAATAPGKQPAPRKGKALGKVAPKYRDPDTGATYYQHWLATLERLVAIKGVAASDALARTKRAWARAAERTPHGTPIELSPADFKA